jgi:hypothetical protein
MHLDAMQTQNSMSLPWKSQSEAVADKILKRVEIRKVSDVESMRAREKALVAHSSGTAWPPGASRQNANLSGMAH